MATFLYSVTLFNIQTFHCCAFPPAPQIFHPSSLPYCSSSCLPPPPDTPALLLEPSNPPQNFWGQIHFSCLGSVTVCFLFFFSLSLVFVNRSPAQCQRERINEMFWLQRRARSHTHTYTDTQGRGQTQAPLCRQPRRPPICPGGI